MMLQLAMLLQIFRQYRLRLQERRRLFREGRDRIDDACHFGDSLHRCSVAETWPAIGFRELERFGWIDN